MSGGVRRRFGGALSRGLGGNEAGVARATLGVEPGPWGVLIGGGGGPEVAGQAAQAGRAGVAVLVLEPAGNEHADPDRHDGDVEDRAAHGSSPRRSYRAGRDPERSEQRPVVPGRSGLGEGEGYRRTPALVTQRKG